MSSGFSLSQLGWRNYFSQQLSLEDLERYLPARVANVHRSAITLWSTNGEAQVLAGTLHDQVTVGDWTLFDPAAGRVMRLLDRISLIARMAAGLERRTQLVAANIETLFIVTSCNDDFNASRLERYLSLTHEAHVDPVIVLTKRDLCADIDSQLDTLREIAPQTAAIAVNATDRDSVAALTPWLTTGATVAFVGSSGVGKSTLVNTLADAQQATGGIREADSRGRHTTTARQLIAMPGGAWLIDTPGMRELKVGAIAQGLRTTFEDVEQLAKRCRFRDCRHGGELGCAVAAAIDAATLSSRRLENYLKLQREARHASESVFERRERSRRFGKMHKQLQDQQRRDRGKQ